MSAVFDRPVAAIYFEDALRTRLFRRAAGNPHSGLAGDLAGFFVNGLALDQEDLADMWGERSEGREVKQASKQVFSNSGMSLKRIQIG